MARLVLDPDPAAVRLARRFVAEQCARDRVSEDVRDTAVLLTSELVTNAFTHGRSEARLEVRLDGRVLRIEVGDDNSRHPQEQDQDADALDGRGLAILDVLCQAWGVRDEAMGKVVWFDLSLTVPARVHAAG